MENPEQMICTCGHEAEAHDRDDLCEVEGCDCDEWDPMVGVYRCDSDLPPRTYAVNTNGSLGAQLQTNQRETKEEGQEP